MKPPKQPTVQEQIDREIHRHDAYLEIVLDYTVGPDVARKVMVELEKVTRKMKGK